VRELVRAGYWWLTAFGQEVRRVENEATPRERFDPSRFSTKSARFRIHVSLSAFPWRCPLRSSEISSGIEGFANAQGSKAACFTLLRPKVSIEPSKHLPLPKRPGKARPKTEKEVHMNTIITMNELYGLTDQELGELHQLLTLLLVEADPVSQARRNILASLKNIARSRGHIAKPNPRPTFRLS
jgi:hypothetical protein